MWQGLSTVTSYKPKGHARAAFDHSLPNELNNFYSRFDAANTESPVFIPANLRDQNGLSVSLHEVCKVLSKTKVRKAAGPDSIPPRVVRLCSEQLSPVLTDMFNMSLERRLVPRSFKEFIMIPVPKKSPVTCHNDYRPIALTSVLMKCLEWLVLNSIKCQIPVSVDPLQFAYRKNRSVEDAVSFALNSVYEHLDNGKASVRMLFIDYSSAFYTIIPSNLIQVSKKKERVALRG